MKGSDFGQWSGKGRRMGVYEVCIITVVSESGLGSRHGIPW